MPTLPAAATPPLRVGLIGDSEHGKYGHGLQKLFIGRTDGVVVAIADPHAGPRGEIAAEVGGEPAASAGDSRPGRPG